MEAATHLFAVDMLLRLQICRFWMKIEWLMTRSKFINGTCIMHPHHHLTRHQPYRKTTVSLPLHFHRQTKILGVVCYFGIVIKTCG